MRLKKVLEYCEDDIAWEIEGFATWEEKNWDKLKAEMMHEWRREDTEQLMYTRIFLEEYVRKPRGKDGLKHYYRQYDRIAKVLVVRNRARFLFPGPPLHHWSAGEGQKQGSVEAGGFFWCPSGFR